MAREREIASADGEGAADYPAPRPELAAHDSYLRKEFVRASE